MSSAACQSIQKGPHALTDGDTLRHAAIRGDEAAVAFFLALGVDPNLRQDTDARALPDSNPGKTALHYAAGYGRAGVIGLLLEAGADPNVRRMYGDTPLLEWVRGCSGSERDDPSRNYHASALLLLEAGADPHASDRCPSGSAWNAALGKGVLSTLQHAIGEVCSRAQASFLEQETPIPLPPSLDGINRL